jgi:hypothetical protein
LPFSQQQKNFDQKRLIQLCGASRKVYQNALTSIQNVVKTEQPAISLHQLGVKFGGSRIVALVAQVLKEYEVRIHRLNHLFSQMVANRQIIYQRLQLSEENMQIFPDRFSKQPRFF